MENTTGRDGYILRQALALAIVALKNLPTSRQPLSDIADMKALLGNEDSFSVSLALCQATLKLDPARDWRDVYREYGIQMRGDDAASPQG